MALSDGMLMIAEHQIWEYNEGRITQPQNGGLCLTVTDSFEVQPSPGLPKGGSWGIVAEACQSSGPAAVNQTWTLEGNGNIVLAALNLCIDVRGCKFAIIQTSSGFIEHVDKPLFGLRL